MPYCYECGSEVAERHRFCPECGVELDGGGGGQPGGRSRPPDGRGQQRPESRPGRPTNNRWGDDGPGRQAGRRTGRGVPGSASEQASGGRGPGEGPQTAGGRGSQQPARAGQQAQSEKGLLGFSIGYPSRGGAGTVLLGGVVLFFFWLVIPLFLAAGYFVRLAAAAAGDRPEPPGFGEWAGMLRDGVVLAVAGLPIWLTYAVLVTLAEQTNLGLYLGVSLLGWYLLPAVFLSFAVERSWRSIYDLGTFTALLPTRGYVVGFLLYTLVINGIGLFVVLILLILTGITFVGLILWPVIFFYWFAIDAALWGRVYRQVMGPATVPDPPTQGPSPGRQQPQPRRPQQY